MGFEIGIFFAGRGFCGVCGLGLLTSLFTNVFFGFCTSVFEGFFSVSLSLCITMVRFNLVDFVFDLSFDPADVLTDLTSTRSSVNCGTFEPMDVTGVCLVGFVPFTAAFVASTVAGFGVVGVVGVADDFFGILSNVGFLILFVSFD